MSPVVFRDRAGGATGVRILHIQVRSGQYLRLIGPLLLQGVTIKFSSSYNLTAYREHQPPDTAFVAFFPMTLAPLDYGTTHTALGQCLGAGGPNGLAGNRARRVGC